MSKHTSGHCEWHAYLNRPRRRRLIEFLPDAIEQRIRERRAERDASSALGRIASHRAAIGSEATWDWDVPAWLRQNAWERHGATGKAATCKCCGRRPRGRRPERDWCECLGFIPCDADDCSLGSGHGGWCR